LGGNKSGTSRRKKGKGKKKGPHQYIRTNLIK
jgi:hypothetical protein